MTPDELRALADALSRQRQADEHGIYCAVPRQAVDAAIKYLRACADAQLVRAVPLGHALSAVRHVGSANYPNRERVAIERLYSAEFDAYAHPAPAAPAGWKWVPVEPTPEMLSAVGMMDGYDWHAPGCSPDADHANWYSAMIAAAPAAPQAEPCIGNDSACPCQDGDACHYKDAADGTKAWPVPQAEPKRDDRPVLDLLAIIHCDGGHHTEAVGLDQSIKDAQAAVCELKRELAMGKREPLTDERIASVCLSYRHDFGLLSGDEQAGLMLEARAWERAFRKEWQRC